VEEHPAVELATVPIPGAVVDQARRVAALLTEVLAGDVMGVYLYGSAVLGGLRPASDIDLLAVSRRRTEPAERRELIKRLMPLSGRAGEGARSIELTVVARPDVQPWRFPPRQDLLYGDWWRGEFESGNFAPWVPLNPDLTIVLEMVLQANRPVCGPPPGELFGPIPWADGRRGMLDSMPALLSYLDGDERNVVLTFVRIWDTLFTGVIRSKDGAAAWALPRLPPEHRPVLQRARELYLAGGPEDWGDVAPGIRPFVDYVMDQIDSEASR
jgi:predicted nucleotidyltransferase